MIDRIVPLVADMSKERGASAKSSGVLCHIIIVWGGCNRLKSVLYCSKIRNDVRFILDGLIFEYANKGLKSLRRAAIFYMTNRTTG
jgi:hypothetical protein